MTTLIRILFLILLFAGTTASAADKLAEQFTNPPESTKPRCYWYWMDGHIYQGGDHQRP